MLVAQIYNSKAMILEVSLVSDQNIYLIKEFINYCNDKKLMKLNSNF